MSMQSWVETTPSGWRQTGLRRWRTETDGAGEDCSASISILPAVVGSEDEPQVGLLGFRFLISGTVTPGGTEGFRIWVGHTVAPKAQRSLGESGYLDRVSAVYGHNGVPSQMAWAGVSSNGNFGILNHAYVFDRFVVTYDNGSNAGGLLQWIEVWSFRSLPGLGSPFHMV